MRGWAKARAHVGGQGWFKVMQCVAEEDEVAHTESELRQTEKDVHDDAPVGSKRHLKVRDTVRSNKKEL